jgi:hypothetical protein
MRYMLTLKSVQGKYTSQSHAVEPKRRAALVANQIYAGSQKLKKETIQDISCSLLMGGA